MIHLFIAKIKIILLFIKNQNLANLENKFGQFRCKDALISNILNIKCMHVIM
jgi:hypothetical protein